MEVSGKSSTHPITLMWTVDPACLIGYMTQLGGKELDPGARVPRLDIGSAIYYLHNLGK